VGDMSIQTLYCLKVSEVSEVSDKYQLKAELISQTKIILAKLYTEQKPYKKTFNLLLTTVGD